ncbi:MAG: mannose-1-phosphate guanylyltransferase [Bacteroidales bacterium]|nr:mannose-1-phosphate guanylyltransferase [Bacteroidales bacterium]
MNHTYCIIMAGGIGARFWPMSRIAKPKQFIDILGTGTTLIQQTFLRFKNICPPENIYVVTHELYKNLVLEQLPELTEDQVLLETCRRNTAPCAAYAAYKIKKKDPDAILVVAPSDHIIMKEDIFTEKINTAIRAAEENDWLITLGIKPSRPDTGYGYIQFNKNITDDRYEGLSKVKTFTEKPNHDLAVTFLQSGEFLWNSGIFIWSLKSILKAFDDYLPEISQLFNQGNDAYFTHAEHVFVKNTYAVCKSISIDYGIMEHAQNVFVIESDFGWSDLGTWGSLHEIRKKDENNNAVTGKHVLTYDSRNSIINMPSDKLVVIQGLDDYIVVEDENTLLICRKQDEQQIRQIVNDVRMQKGERFV